MPSPNFAVKCPACQTKFAIAANSAGQTIACPQCQTMMRLPASLGPKPADPGTAAGPPPMLPPPLPPPIPELDEEPYRPAPAPSRSLSRRRRDEEDDDDRDDDRDDDDYDDRPRRRRRQRRGEPHRGTTILVLGILAILGIAWPVLGPMAWIMGKGDLAKIREGTMDPEGQSNTQVGYVMGIIATCLYGSIMVLCCGGIFLSAALGPHRH
jgi:hypothetical protein